jgi:hypothetical protein
MRHGIRDRAVGGPGTSPPNQIAKMLQPLRFCKVGRTKRAQDKQHIKQNMPEVRRDLTNVLIDQ